jgi:hypothetical protein
MKLAAIYNIWDGVEHLESSVNSIRNDVDYIIFVYQDVSNYGEKYDPLSELQKIKHDVTFLYEPDLNSSPASNEKNKRNIGIQIALKLGCTHFLHLDCDEVYPNFKELKKEFIDSGKDGSVCKITTYFGKSNYCFEKFDNYYVPFIHKLNNDTVAGGRQYPFYVDPTRKINSNNVSLLQSGLMHHYSWVRDDIERKIRNSTARCNIEISQLLLDYKAVMLLSANDVDGFYIKDYDMKLITLP